MKSKEIFSKAGHIFMLEMKDTACAMVILVYSYHVISRQIRITPYRYTFFQFLSIKSIYKALVDLSLFWKTDPINHMAGKQSLPHNQACTKNYKVPNLRLAETWEAKFKRSNLYCLICQTFPDSNSGSLYYNKSSPYLEIMF